MGTYAITGSASGMGLRAWRAAVAATGRAEVVVFSSNSTTTMPLVPRRLAHRSEAKASKSFPVFTGGFGDPAQMLTSALTPGRVRCRATDWRDICTGCALLSGVTDACRAALGMFNGERWKGGTGYVGVG